MSSDAERDWQAYAARTGVPKPIRGTQDWNTERSAFRAGYQAGAEWERSRPVSEAEAEAALVAQHEFVFGLDGPLTEREKGIYRPSMRVALEAAAKVRAQGGNHE